VVVVVLPSSLSRDGEISRYHSGYAFYLHNETASFIRSLSISQVIEGEAEKSFGRDCIDTNGFIITVVKIKLANFTKLGIIYEYRSAPQFNI